MRFAVTRVPAFANDAACMHQYRAYHGIRRYPATAPKCQLESAA